MVSGGDRGKKPPPTKRAAKKKAPVKKAAPKQTAAQLRSEDTFVASVLTGSTQQHAAAAAGISENTACRWMKDPRIAKRVSDGRAALWEQNITGIAALEAKARRVLDEQMDSKSPKVALLAARTVMMEARHARPTAATDDPNPGDRGMLIDYLTNELAPE